MIESVNAREIICTTIPEAHRCFVSQIWKHGKEVEDQRGDLTRELLNVHVWIKGPDCTHVPGALNETLDNDFALGLISDVMAAKKAEEFDYSYGDRARRRFQLEYVVGKLKNTPETRRAYLPLYLPEDNGTYAEVPCCVGLDVIIRNGRLDLTTIFRSNDIFGAFPADTWGYRALQAYFCEVIGVKMGDYHSYIISAHLIMHRETEIKKFLGVKL